VEGRVIGVNSAIYSPSGGSVGIGFDIPAEVAASVTRQLIENGKVTRGYIGATVQNLTPDLAASLGLKSPHGAIVDQLTARGPAEQAGVKSGDVIASVNGRSVQSSDDLTRQVALARPGEDITLGVIRSGKMRDVTIRSGLRPSEALLADGGGSSGGGVLGLQVSPDPSGGLLVDGVAPNSDAQTKGIRAGDVILRAAQAPVATAADLAQAADQARAAGRNSVPLLVARGGQKLYVPVQLEGKSG
jgi:serine protease Do